MGSFRLRWNQFARNEYGLLRFAVLLRDGFHERFRGTAPKIVEHYVDFVFCPFFAEGGDQGLALLTQRDDRVSACALKLLERLGLRPVAIIFLAPKRLAT